MNNNPELNDVETTAELLDLAKNLVLDELETEDLGGSEADTPTQLEDWGTAEVSLIEIGGRVMQLPWHPVAKKTLMVKGVPQTENVAPAFVNNLQALSKNPTSQALARSFMVSVGREIMIKSQPRITMPAVQGNIVLTSRLPKNTFVVTDEFIYVSSHYITWAGVKWDFDGDSVRLGFNAHLEDSNYQLKAHPGVEFRGRPVVPIKNPITRKIRPGYWLEGKILQWVGPEPWWDFTLSEKMAWDRTDRELRIKELEARQPRVNTPGLPAMSEREYVFRKTHDIQAVGQADGKVKNYFLKLLDTLPLEEKQNRLYEGDVAFEVLENGALGAVRKDHTIATDQTTLSIMRVEANKYRVPHAYSPFLTRTGSVGSIPRSQTLWPFSLNLAQHLMRVSRLDIPAWRTVGERPEQEPQVRTQSHNVVWDLVDANILQYEVLARDEHVEERFSNPESPEYIPPAVRVFLVRRGQIVSLTNVPKAQGVLGGTVQTFILPPVWDVEEGKWHDPIAYMHRMAQPVWERMSNDDEWTLVQGVDLSIFNPELLTSRNWGRNQQGGFMPGDFFSARRTAQAKNFARWLSAYVGRYGLVVPTIADRNLSVPRPNLRVASNVAIVDYGRRGFHLDSWWKAFSQIPEVLCPASKGDDTRVRKYAMTREVGEAHPWWAPKDVNPRRAGQMLSQLSRMHKSMKMRVAIVVPTPQTGNVSPTEWGEANQVQITGEGTRLQLLDGPLGNTVFSDRISHEPVANAEIQEFTTLDGEMRGCWLKDAKRSKRVGKLLDMGMGGKFMPMPTLGFKEAWTLERTTEVQELELGSDLKVLVGHDSTTGEPQYRHYTIDAQNPSTDPDRVAVLDENGTRYLITRSHIQTEVEVWSRAPIHLFYPVKELVDKGLYAHYMARAKPEMVYMDNGQQLLCYVLETTFCRTSGPTENERTKHKKIRVRGTDMHLVIAGARRAQITHHSTALMRGGELVTESVNDFAVNVPNLPYCERIKEVAINVLNELGWKNLFPTEEHNMSFEQLQAKLAQLSGGNTAQQQLAGIKLGVSGRPNA